MFTAEEMTTRLAEVCQPCHKAIHTFWSEKELALEYNTMETIIADERMQAHIRWARKQRPGLHMRGRRYGQKEKRW